jgi:hypothetical protein
MEGLRGALLRCGERCVLRVDRADLSRERFPRALRQSLLELGDCGLLLGSELRTEAAQVLYESLALLDFAAEAAARASDLCCDLIRRFACRTAFRQSYSSTSESSHARERFANRLPRSVPQSADANPEPSIASKPSGGIGIAVPRSRDPALRKGHRKRRSASRSECSNRARHHATSDFPCAIRDRVRLPEAFLLGAHGVPVLPVLLSERKIRATERFGQNVLGDGLVATDHLVPPAEATSGQCALGRRAKYARRVAVFHLRRGRRRRPRIFDRREFGCGRRSVPAIH